MKIQKKKEREMAERQGSTKTTLIFGSWLVLSMLIAYFFFSYLDSSGTLTMRTLRSQMQLPPSIPEWAVMVGAILVFTMASQIALSLGFFLANPSARRKVGKGDLRSRHHDLRDNY
jgi:ABC-type uncharacterized transport system fused permease/ATPase subunit